MPRPHRPRSVGGEDNLAERVAREREVLALSYEGLAKLMTEAGCPMQGSAIYKIEKGAPRRRISVDELVAFAAVFETTTEDLLTPIEVLDNERAKELLSEMREADLGLTDATRRVVQVYAEFQQLAAFNPDLHEYVFGHRFPRRPSQDGEDGQYEGNEDLFHVSGMPNHDTRPFSRAFMDFWMRTVQEASEVARASVSADRWVDVDE